MVKGIGGGVRVVGEDCAWWTGNNLVSQHLNGGI